LTFKPLLCGGPIVNTLIQSKVGRYMEFKCVNSVYIYLEGGLQTIPCKKLFIIIKGSSGEIFSNKFISLKEKTFLTKFITFCIDFDKKESSIELIKGNFYI
jgi:Rab proteins geranylgeranyltransferase component A